MTPWIKLKQARAYSGLGRDTLRALADSGEVKASHTPGGQGEGRVFSRWDHPDTISHMVKEALRGFGLGHVHLHHLRHTFATLLLSAGEGMKVIGSLLGHTDHRATEIYAHVTGDLERAAIRKIKAGVVEL